MLILSLLRCRFKLLIWLKAIVILLQLFVFVADQVWLKGAVVKDCCTPEIPGRDPCDASQVFDFELPDQGRCFSVDSPTNGNISVSTDLRTVKHGAKSLKWQATGPSNLLLKSPKFKIPNHWLLAGGMKIWMRKDSPSTSGEQLKVVFRDSVHEGPFNSLANFRVNLDFQGWRTVWVKFQEAKIFKFSLHPPAVIDEVLFSLSAANLIVLDLVEFLPHLGRQTRDKIVPPISPFGLTHYDARDYWQRTYHWSQQYVPALPSEIDEKKLSSLEHIESTLRNWYHNASFPSSMFPSGGFLEQRWKSLLKNADDAHTKYDNLPIVDGSVVGPPLFCLYSRYGKRGLGDKAEQFGHIFAKILLPLALEFKLRSGIIEVKATVNSQLNALTKNYRKKAVQAIAGNNKNMANHFEALLGPPHNLTKERVEKAIKDLNIARLNKINNILDYTKEQGFADGSGLGSLDHEMNVDDSGFMHTLFLLKDSLSLPSNKPRLLDLIRTAKWYNDFGEIYQSPSFEHNGTTADRIITLMLYRLIIVLVMPSDTTNEKKAKLRDMEALVRWINNALTVNEGLGGMIKPDFTGYHHNSFYGSAYVPKALHIAALVQYLLEGTEFSLTETSKNNIRKGLETLRIVAVKYSVPNSVSGRSPGYFNKKLVAILPAFLYISIYRSSDGQNIVKGQNEVKMFLRLFDESDPSITSYLANSPSHVKKFFLKSLGSLYIMKKIANIALKEKMITPEPSPEGHWSKNFAALSIHRRKDWAVTMKGFNRFVWDFEHSIDENIYGMFASHGAMLVANNESVLEAHDVERGWDWSKVPGTTTIAWGDRKNMEKLKTPKRRYYSSNPSLAGGVTLKGTKVFSNGLFGMELHQPEYGFTDWRKDIIFSFKKSVFFFENLLVCLGSEIYASRTRGAVIQTTLFQDKLVDRESPPSHIEINNVKKNYFTPIAAITPTTDVKKYASVQDTKGNGYYIPEESAESLRVHLLDQVSRTEDGQKASVGRYGTAWFEHTALMTSPSGYQYAVVIPTQSYNLTLDSLITAQENAGSEVYKVLQRDFAAHVVRFLRSPISLETEFKSRTTGYVIFHAQYFIPPEGPLKAVNRPCLIMAEESLEFLHLSISYPDLDFPVTPGQEPLTHSGKVGEEMLFNVSSKENELQVTLNNQVDMSIAGIKVHGEPNHYTPKVTVVSSSSNSTRTGDTVVFWNLKNGFSVEVSLTKRDRNMQEKRAEAL